MREREREGEGGERERETDSPSFVQCYIHRNRRLIRDGKPWTATSTFTQLLNYETTFV